MPFDTTLKSGFITDLIVPPTGTCGKQTPELEQICYDTAIGILHNFEEFIRSSPLVINVQQIHPGHQKYIDVPAFCKEFDIQPQPDYAISDWVQFEITDKLNVLFGLSTQLIYHTAMRKTKTGFEGVTNPGSGVRIHGRFDVQKSAETDGVVNFIEHNETRCNLFLSAYIKATTGSSHKTMHENFKHRWNEDMKKRLKS
jgi:hypothetical protein